MISDPFLVIWIKFGIGLTNKSRSGRPTERPFVSCMDTELHCQPLPSETVLRKGKKCMKYVKKCLCQETNEISLTKAWNLAKNRYNE